MKNKFLGCLFAFDPLKIGNQYDVFAGTILRRLQEEKVGELKAFNILVLRTLGIETKKFDNKSLISQLLDKLWILYRESI